MVALAKFASSAGGRALRTRASRQCHGAARGEANAEAAMKNLGGMRDASCQFPLLPFSLTRRASAAREKKTGGHRGQRGARMCSRLRSSESQPQITSRPVPAPRFLTAGTESQPVRGSGGRGESSSGGVAGPAFELCSARDFPTGC